jgi:hypothetical protein
MPAQTGLTQPITPQPMGAQPTFTPRPVGAGMDRAQRETDEPRRRRGRRADNRSREPGGGRLSRIWEGSLRGGLGVCVILGSALIGAIATVVTKNQPGSMLGLFVLAGTVAASLTVQPRTGRLIFPVPALSYLIAALGSGVVYDRHAGKTAIAVGAAQWIASGFFVMVLATLLAIALTTVRWFMWRRDQRDPVPPDRPMPGPRPGSPRRGGTQPGMQPTQWPPRTEGPWDQRSGPRPEQGPGWAPDRRPGPAPGSGPYNFSSGA